MNLETEFMIREEKESSESVHDLFVLAKLEREFDIISGSVKQ